MSNWGILYQDMLYDNAWALCKYDVLLLKNKIEKVGRPLKDWDIKIYSGIKTGCNEAFIIDTETRNRILANCKDEEERKRTEEIIRPILKGRDIKKYRYKWAELWMIYIPRHFPLHNDKSISGASLKAEEEFKRKYPALYSYLLHFKDRLLKRNKDETGIRYEWYALSRMTSNCCSEFEKENIAWKRIGEPPAFTIVSSEYYCDATANVIKTKENDYYINRYLLGILNSRFFEFTFYKFYMGGGVEGEITVSSINNFPVPQITEKNKAIVNQIIQKVDEILTSIENKDYGINQEGQKEIKDIQKEIDILVYRLYELDNEEIKIIDIYPGTLNTGNWDIIYQDKLSDDIWTLGNKSVLDLKEKIERIGSPLKDWDVDIHRGITTGYNDAFIINTETRDRILSNCKDEEERKRTEEIIKPVLKGRDIKKYRYKWGGLWVILARVGFHKVSNLYPAVVEHLSKYEDRLKERDQKRLELIRNLSDECLKQNERERIILQEISNGSNCAYINEDMFIDGTALLITGEDLKYLLGVLNSKPVEFFFEIFYTSGRLGEDTYRYKKVGLGRIPIPPIVEENKYIVKQIIQKVDQILTITKSEDYEINQKKQKEVDEIQKEIDILVYQLYELDNKEIKIIEV